MLIGSIGALIEQAVLDGGARGGRIDLAKAEADEALADYHQALLTAIEEVEATLAALDASLARRESLRLAVEASDRSFHQAESLYKQGLTSFLDVVDAQRVLATAQQRLATANTGYATQIAQLFRVLGTHVNVEKKSDATP